MFDTDEVLPGIHFMKTLMRFVSRAEVQLCICGRTQYNSPGPCCPAANSIDIRRCSQRQPDGRGKTLRLEGPERFPLSHRHDDETLE
jgi:hypothetical protein